MPWNSSKQFSNRGLVSTIHLVITFTIYGKINGTQLEPFTLSRGILTDTGDDASNAEIQDEQSHEQSGVPRSDNNGDFLSKSI